MLLPVDVVPPLSKALRYSMATDLRCSSVMVCMVRLIAVSLPDGLIVRGVGCPVCEGDDRPEGGAAGPVRTGRRRGNAVADSVQSGDRLVGVVDDLTVR